jgi:oligopeptide/dipeptide ABC transporter ATP-binding protein
MEKPLLLVEGLNISFPGRDNNICVVDDVSFSLKSGESLVIAGESGSGKSMICQALLGITPKTATVGGTRMEWDGRDLLAMKERDWREIRGEKIAMIFQDATAALNPLFSVEQQISDVVRAHTRCTRAEARARTIKVLGLAEFPEPEQRMSAYPSELSGGMRQRVAIALALSCSPSLIIADEATSNLDVSIQAQIVTLLNRLRENLGVALIFVTHDLGLATEFGGDILVMYAGQAVERGPVRSVLVGPCHPYTRGLLQSAPTLSSTRANPLRPIPGMAPKPGTVGTGAPFRSRCEVIVDGVCQLRRPDWTKVAGGHEVACHRFARDGRKGVA